MYEVGSWCNTKCLGPFITLLLSQLKDVQRTDSTLVDMGKKISTREELKGLVRLALGRNFSCLSLYCYTPRSLSPTSARLLPVTPFQRSFSRLGFAYPVSGSDNRERDSAWLSRLARGKLERKRKVGVYRNDRSFWKLGLSCGRKSKNFQTLCRVAGNSIETPINIKYGYWHHKLALD